MNVDELVQSQFRKKTYSDLADKPEGHKLQLITMSVRYPEDLGKAYYSSNVNTDELFQSTSYQQ